ncbi:MAG: YicC family protein [Ignavibacteriaceae bacterium]|nr:YicC family protein [Ignavibacteriaceae bacterium]
MILSMTGYGKSTRSFGGYIFESEAKSFNSRYLELSLKLPPGLQNKEYELREPVKNFLKRGKVYININIRPEDVSAGDLVLNESKLKAVLSIFEKLKDSYGVSGDIKLEHLIFFKDIFSHELDDLGDDHFEALKSALIESLSELNKMRENEGRMLSNELLKRTGIIAEKLQFIENDFVKNKTEYFARLKERVSELLDEPDNERLDTELALLAERTDITEECVRLRSHLNFFNEAVEKENEAGKRLNFICQEMHREANTIASKSLATEIVHSSVMIREEIEKIREQVQNIE